VDERTSKEFAIFAMCLVRNEADIIAQCLRSAAVWSDAIFVYDNGSDDGTWEIVRELAQVVPGVIPFRQDTKPFSDSLRGEIFEHYRASCAEGDWWCRLDADEFYIDNPRVFLKSVSWHSDVVWSASFQYYFTEKEAERYRLNPEAFANDVPVEDKCRHYRNDWSEPRFFRYHKSLNHNGFAWPRPLGSSNPARIRLKHFQYRSPDQISRRLATRRDAMAVGMFRHEKVPDWSSQISARQPTVHGAVPGFFPSSWEERIVDSQVLNCDDETVTYVIEEHMLPPIRQLA